MVCQITERYTRSADTRHRSLGRGHRGL